MAAVKVSDIRALVRINLDDPLKWNEADLGVGSVPNQRIFQFPTRPINPLSEVVTIDSAAKTRGVDYTILNEAGQLFFASPPAGGSMHAYWQYSRWSDVQLNQWITEASRLLSVQAPKISKQVYVADAAAVLAQGWTTDVTDQRVFKVRSFDPPSPLGGNLLWQEIPYWRWDEADHFLRLDGTFLAADQFEVHALRRWVDPDTTLDQMDPGRPTGLNLVTDGSFESGSLANVQTNWILGTSSEFILDTSGTGPAPDGKASMLCTTTRTSVGWNRITPTKLIPVNPQLPYTFAFWWTQSGGGKQTHFKVTWWRDENNLFFSNIRTGDAILSGTDGYQPWTRVVSTLTPPADAGYMKIEVMCGYWDGITDTNARIAFDSVVVVAGSVLPGADAEEGWPIEFNDPVAWLVTAQALEKVESPRDMQGLEGDIIDAQASPTGSFVRDAQFWHKKFDTWLTAYQRTRYEQRPRREPYWL